MEKAEPMDEYLLRLGLALSHLFPSDESVVLRVLSETEDHLHQAVERNRDAGLAPSDAEREAIRRFGPPETVADRFGRELDGVLSLRGLFVRSYVHLGSLAGTLVAAIGAACLVLSVAAAVLSPLTVFGMADPPPGYLLAQCGSQAPRDLERLREFGGICTTAPEEWVDGPQAAVSHSWFTVGGAVILAVGAGLWGAHRALLSTHVGDRKDHSLLARAHAVLGVLFFGLGGLFVWSISTAAAFSGNVPLEPPMLGSWVIAGAPVTAIMFLAYTWYARSVFVLRA